MATRRERAEAYQSELLRAIRADRDNVTRAIGNACRKLLHPSSLGAMLGNVSQDEAIRLLKQGGTSRLTVLAEHPDGRVREQAVRALRRVGAEGLSPLIRRANDWVPSIASEASLGAVDLLPKATDAELRTLAPQIFLLVGQRRRDHALLIGTYLEEAVRRPRLARRLRHHTVGGVARWLFANLQGDDESEEDVLRQALAHGDPGVAAWGARRAVANPALRKILHGSRSARLRRLALDSAPADVLETALDDLDAGVRNDARYLLGKRDYVAHYRAALPMPGAISGLGETGTSEDAGFIVPLLSHPSPEVRRRVVDSIFRLLGNDAEFALLASLRDPSRKVQRVAAKALIASSLAIDPETIVRSDLKAHVQWALMDRTPQWQGLVTVLGALSTLPPSDEWIHRWAERSRRSGMRPDETQMMTAIDRLAAAESRLQPDTLDVVRAALGVWSSR